MKRGLFSVSYAGLWGQECLDLPSFIGKAGELGYDGVLLAAKRPHLSPLDAGEHEVAANWFWCLQANKTRLVTMQVNGNRP